MNRNKKRPAEEMTSNTKRAKTEHSVAMNTDDGHNNIDYYLKGDKLDTHDTKIVTSFNHIYFYSPITRKSAADLIISLFNVDYENIEDIHKSVDGQIKPIYLHMLCEGGDIFAALAIYDNIQRLRSEVHCYVDGFLSSAAIMILLACQNRYMSNNSFLGIHSIKMSVWGKLQFLQQCNANYNKIWNSLEQLYEKKTKLKQNKINIKKFMTESQIMDSDMALKYGFITDLV